MTISAGNLILAEPFMEDDNFKQSVIFICEKSDTGSFGLVINKPTNILMTETLDDFPAVECMLFDGGPMQRDTIHFLTSKGDLIDDSLLVCEGIYWGGNFDRLKFLLDTKQISSNEVRFFIGYSGWEPGQIEYEQNEGSWIIANADPEKIFSTDPSELWKNVLKDLGGNYSVIANLPDTPLLN
jgi:putative transcriptional regulator